jgi:hypothetical protein
VSLWNTILTADELDARWARMAALDAAFAARAKDFWKSRTPAQLDALADQAWLTSDDEQHMVARSYRAITPNENRWWPIRQRPAAHRRLVCLTEDQKEYSGLSMVPTRGGIIEPITNRLAEPVIGRIVGWRYESENCF